MILYYQQKEDGLLSDPRLFDSRKLLRELAYDEFWQAARKGEGIIGRMKAAYTAYLELRAELNRIASLKG